MIDSGVDTKTVFLWNIFPCHPIGQNGMLSNRAPDRSELQIGSDVYLAMKALLQPLAVIAVGNKAYDVLSNLGEKVVKVRHPANGGARQYRQQIREIFEGQALA